MPDTSPVAVEGFAPDLPTWAFLGDSGIVLADGSITDSDGCAWKWGPTNAWGNKPAPREQATDRTYGHGQADATRYYGPRVLSIPGTVKAPTHAAIHDAEQRLRDAVTVEPFTLRIVEPGYDGFALVRQQGDILWAEDGTPRTPHASFNIGLYAPDPRIWSSRERTFDIGFPSTTGGLTWPTTWPAVWNAVTVSGSVVLYNPSRVGVGLTLTVTGPATTVSIAFPTTGQAMNLQNPDGPVLTAGQYLTIDTDTRQVLLNGDAGRRSWVYGDWLQLPANSDTTLAIAGTGTTLASRVTGTYRAARL